MHAPRQRGSLEGIRRATAPPRSRVASLVARAHLTSSSRAVPLRLLLSSTASTRIMVRFILTRFISRAMNTRARSFARPAAATIAPVTASVTVLVAPPWNAAHPMVVALTTAITMGALGAGGAALVLIAKTGKDLLISVELIKAQMEVIKAQQEVATKSSSEIGKRLLTIERHLGIPL
jgi:hypothetical protein